MNISAVLKALALIPSLLPIISAFVQQAEDLLAGASGSAKLQAVCASINAYIVKIEGDVTVVTELQKLVAPLIDATVAMFNAAGLFKKSTAA